jgi:galactitol-specific phosphotransferase system IIC component
LKGKDWGRLIARLLSIMLLLDLAQTVPAAWGNLFGENAVPDSWLNWGVPIIFTAVAAVLLWIFADRFAPASESGQESGIPFVGAVVVATIAVHTLLTYGHSLIEELALRAKPEELTYVPSDVTLVYYIVACTASVAVLCNARKVATWIAR